MAVVGPDGRGGSPPAPAAAAPVAPTPGRDDPLCPRSPQLVRARPPLPPPRHSITSRGLCGPSRGAEGVRWCRDTPAGHAPPWGPLDALDAVAIWKGQDPPRTLEGVQIYSLGSKVIRERKPNRVQVVSKWCPSGYERLPRDYLPSVQSVQVFQETPTKSERPRGGVTRGKDRITRTPPTASDPMGIPPGKAWTLGHIDETRRTRGTTRAQHHLDTLDRVGHPPRHGSGRGNLRP